MTLFYLCIPEILFIVGASQSVIGFSIDSKTVVGSSKCALEKNFFNLAYMCFKNPDDNIFNKTQKYCDKKIQ